MPTEKEKAKRDAELRKAARDRAAAALLGPAVAAGAVRRCRRCRRQALGRIVRR